jgi:DNA-binding NtrC family response regulator
VLPEKRPCRPFAAFASTALVLDLEMGDMDGIEVLKIFKKMDPTMPVTMVTSHGSETAAREGVKFRAFDYLTIPCDFTEGSGCHTHPQNEDRMLLF